MSCFSKFVACLFVVFFCTDAEAQLFRRARSSAQSCTPVCRCEPQAKSNSQVQVLTPAPTHNYRDVRGIETAEIKGTPFSWGIEGGGGTPIVDAPFDEVFVGEIISIDHQEPFTKGDGVYPLPTIQNYVLDDAVPVYGRIEGQIGYTTADSELAQQPSPVEILSLPVETAPLTVETSPLTVETSPLTVEITSSPGETVLSHDETVPSMVVPASGSFDEAASDIELAAFESSEVGEQSQPVEDAIMETSTVAPLKVDASAPGPTLDPGQEDPSVSILE